MSLIYLLTPGLRMINKKNWIPFCIVWVSCSMPAMYWSNYTISLLPLSGAGVIVHIIKNPVTRPWLAYTKNEKTIMKNGMGAVSPTPTPMPYKVPTLTIGLLLPTLVFAMHTGCRQHTPNIYCFSENVFVAGGGGGWWLQPQESPLYIRYVIVSWVYLCQHWCFP